MANDHPLLFERSTPGARAVDLPASDVPHAEIDPALASFTKSDLPEVGQLDLVRHYTRLAHRNFSVDAHTSPLGFSTMKYSPRVNEWAAALAGFAELHPLQDEADCQGALALLYHLRVMLQEISGLDEVSLQPAAGPHGEWAALKIVRAYLDDAGQPKRREVIVPDTAHGTNPASCSEAGCGVLTVRTGPGGLVDQDDLRSLLQRGDVAALMLSNPTPAGRFDPRAADLARMAHDAGALVYLDTNTFNAAVGLARPGDWGADLLSFNAIKTFAAPKGSGGPGAGPLAVRKFLAPYLPTRQVIQLPASPHAPVSGPVRYAWDHDRPQSIGRVSGFWGQFGVLVRVYAYLRACGPEGLNNVSETAILSANYLAQRIRHAYPLPYGPAEGRPMADEPCAGAFVAVPRPLLERGASVMDVAKGMIDRGVHPPTVHWPVRDCLLIEPTETESKADLDALAEAMLAVAEQGLADPQSLKHAPTRSAVRRVDEMAAARKPVLTWSPEPGE